jgi:FkbM family methyltransferase
MELEQIIDEVNIDDQDLSFNKCIIYGFGSFGKSLVDVLKDKNIEVVCIFDKVATGEYEGTQCYNLDNYDYAQYFDIPILIGIHNRDVDVYTVKDDLLKRGFVDVLLPIDYYGYFETFLGWKYWLSSKKYIIDNKLKIFEARNLLQDNFIFDSIINYRLGKYVDFSLLISDLQYHPKSIGKWPEPLFFVDAGGFNGDTVEEIVNLGYVIDTVYGFEPDTKNFIDYCETMKRLNIRAINFPCGIGEDNEIIPFSNDGFDGNYFGEGEIGLPVCSLDNVLTSNPVNLIKMDIEGFEKEALRGANNLLKNNKPCLAISLYHKPEDLWEIPLLIDSICPDTYVYNIFVHTLNTFDSVLYAIPE